MRIGSARRIRPAGAVGYSCPRVAAAAANRKPRPSRRPSGTASAAATVGPGQVFGPRRGMRPPPAARVRQSRSTVLAGPRRGFASRHSDGLQDQDFGAGYVVVPESCGFGPTAGRSPVAIGPVGCGPHRRCRGHGCHGNAPVPAVLAPHPWTCRAPSPRHAGLVLLTNARGLGHQEARDAKGSHAGRDRRPVAPVSVGSRDVAPAAWPATGRRPHATHLTGHGAASVRPYAGCPAGQSSDEVDRRSTSSPMVYNVRENRTSGAGPPLGVERRVVGAVTETLTPWRARRRPPRRQAAHRPCGDDGAPLASQVTDGPGSASRSRPATRRRRRSAPLPTQGLAPPPQPSTLAPLISQVSNRRAPAPGEAAPPSGGALQRWPGAFEKSSASVHPRETDAARPRRTAAVPQSMSQPIR